MPPMKYDCIFIVSCILHYVKIGLQIFILKCIKISLGGHIMDNFSKLLKDKRKAMRLSLRSAAELIGISHTYLDKLEKGIDSRTGISNKPTPDTLKLISNAYNISYIELLECCDYMPSPNDMSTTDYSMDTSELLEITNRLTRSEIRNLILYARFLEDNRLLLN